MFSGKLVGSFPMKVNVCTTLAKLPDEIIDFITSNCWFFGSLEDSWGFTFTGNDLSSKHLIFLGDELFLQDEEQIEYTIAHEVGHVMLGHRNSILERQSKAEIRQQEKEADEFVRKYLNV